MVNQKVNDVNIITSCNDDDRLLINTDSTNNVLEQMTKENFIIDITSTDINNIVTTGTDNKLFVDDSLLVHKSGAETIDGIKTFNDAPVASTASMTDATDKRLLTDAQLALLTSFNGADELVQLNATGQLPALDGSNLTNVGAFDYSQYDKSAISAGLIPLYFDTQDVSTAIYDNKSLVVSGQDSATANIFLSPDDTKMYTAGANTDTIYQYDLSTAGDLATAVYSTKSKLISAQETSIRDLFITADGLNMYIVGTTSDTVYQYTLSTAWDVSTATYASKSKSVSTETTFPYCLTFSTDGTKMYVGSAGVGTVFQYTLSTAWDISTATYASKSLVVANNVTTINFSSDGTNLVLGFEQQCAEYALAVAFDISTATLSKSTSIHWLKGLGAISLYGFTIRNNTLFALSQANTIYQFSLYEEGYKNIKSDYYSGLSSGNTNTTISTACTYVSVPGLISNIYSSLLINENYYPKIINTGLYEINYSASVTITSTNIGMCIFKNGATVSNTIKDVVSGGGGRYIISDKIILYLSAGDVINLGVTSYTTTGTVTMPNLSFSITRKI